MDNFIVSALKYRPTSFDSVVGQQSITTTLKNAIKNNHLAHAYLFCGPRGVGKTTCARIFAKTLNCLNPSNENEACNNCESCNAFNEDRSFNIHELDAASNNSVENVRSLIDQTRVPPQIGKYSLYIIDEVHMLSQSAFNAFLKTLEEPPDHAIFILATTEKHKIIPTILSRCQIFDFQRIKISDIIGHLKFVGDKEGVETEEDALNIIAQKAEGSMRDSLSIFDQIVSFSGNKVNYENVIKNLNVLDFEYFFKLVDGFLASDYKSCLLTFNEILEKGFDELNFLSGLAKHLRDILVVKDTQTINLIDAGEKLKEKYIIQSKVCSAEFLFAALKICSNAEIAYKSSKNSRLHIEIALLELCNLSEKKKPLVKEVSANSEQNQEKSMVQKVQETVVKEPNDEKRIERKPEKLQVSVKEAFKLIDKSEKVKISSFDENKNDLKEDFVKTEKEEFTELQVQEKWESYISKFKEEKRLYAILSSGKPQVKEHTQIHYSLKNATQELEIKDIKPKLLNFLKKELKNTEVTLHFKIEKIEQDDDKIRLYTDQDKFKYLNEKNNNLELLRQKLNLDFT